METEKIKFIDYDTFAQLDDTRKSVLFATYLNLWVADSLKTNKNADEIVEECKILDKFTTSNEQFKGMIEYQLRKLFMFRKNDLTLLNKLFSIDIEYIAKTCIKILIDLIENSAKQYDINMKFYFDNYEGRFGAEDQEYLMYKLSFYLRMNSNLENNMDIINDLYSKINNKL